MKLSGEAHRSLRFFLLLGTVVGVIWYRDRRSKGDGPPTQPTTRTAGVVAGRTASEADTAADATATEQPTQTGASNSLRNRHRSNTLEMLGLLFLVSFFGTL